MIRIAGLSRFGCCRFAVSGCGGGDDNTTPVAMVGPITGQYATFGAQMQNGAEMAVADINAAGGVLGKKLELAIGDDACDPKQAVAVANQMTGSGAKLVAGHYCSGSSIPASKVYADGDMVQISPASTNPALTDERAGPNIYRVCGRDDQQGGVAGKYLASQFRRQEHRLRSRQDRLRQRPRRRNQEGAERGRQAGGDERGDHRRREGLFGARLQAEAGQYRCHLSSAATTPRPG